MERFSRKIVFAITLSILSLGIKAQTQEIWLDLNYSVGNRYLYPDLEIMKGKPQGPAFFRDGVVYYDSIFINHLESNYDSAFATLATAYLFSHELGHYYLNHTDTHVKSRAYAQTTSKSAVLAGDSRKADLLNKESEADLYGGLYSTQAGYYALDIAEEFLNLVYEYYNLPKELQGYPSLSDRIEISFNLKSIVDNINEAYQIALALAFLGEHPSSQYILKSIIRDMKFQTPEILHLLSFSIFLEAAAEIDNNIINTWNWPINIPFDAYNKNKTRGLESSRIIENLKESRIHEINALELEHRTSSNLLQAIDLVISYELNNLSDYKPRTEIDSNLTSLYFALKGKKKKSIKYLGESKGFLNSNDNKKPQIEELAWTPITSDNLFELRFSNSQNIVLGRKRVAKKFTFSNLSLYEVRGKDGVKINLIREELETASSEPIRFPVRINNSVYFELNSKSIKFQKE